MFSNMSENKRQGQKWRATVRNVFRPKSRDSQGDPPVRPGDKSVANPITPSTVSSSSSHTAEIQRIELASSDSHVPRNSETLARLGVPENRPESEKQPTQAPDV